LRRVIPGRSAGCELAGLATFELLPLPFIAMLVGGYPPALAAALLGSLACLVAVLLNRLDQSRAALQRRSQELATLGQVSQALRSTDSLNDLLASIHQQVSQALSVENFYVALFDSEREKIWYPLAVKSGQRVYWDARSLTDRLTDRVIRSREPILLPRMAGEELVRIGLPPSQDALSAWMGVPLTGAQGLMGCLAVFSFSPQAVFTRDELHWLTTLAGQASVAIESILQTSRSIEESQRRELFTTALVHDLRSPASAVLGALDVIGESQGISTEGDLQAQAVSVARHAAQRLINLIDSLMDIARAQSGSLELSLAAVDLGKLVRVVLADFYPQAKGYGLILRDEMPDDLPQALADTGKVQRVLTNLVDNALKFSPAGGQVAVRARLQDQGMLAVTVSDSGPGIAEEYREKVFERFSQVPGLHGRQRGSGLGLTFCRLVVEAQGGRIWVEAGPGGGSAFIFTLPVAPEPES
jgi:signal transduction histidine kinase